MASEAKPTYVHIANELRSLMMTGELAAGEWLPPEPQLAHYFGVSRGTVREALRMLASWKLITTTRGVHGGTQVARLELSDLSDLLNMGIVMLTHTQGYTVAELLEVREQLEVPAARFAACRRSDEALAALRATIPPPTSRMSFKKIHELGLAFHMCVLEATGNRLLQVLTEPLFTVMASRYTPGQPRAFWQCVTNDHVAIYDAIAGGDGEAAAYEMAVHLGRLRTEHERIDGNEPLIKGRRIEAVLPPREPPKRLRARRTPSTKPA